METPLTTGFAQIFSCCPNNLSCPKFGGAARLCLRLRCLRSAYDLVKTRLSESEAGSDKPIVPTLCDWFGYSAPTSDSDSNSDNLVFTRS